MDTINIGINGFGRIGRTLFRLLQNHPQINVVAINDLADSRTLAHLLKYDSIHGVFSETISHTDKAIIVNQKTIALTNIADPARIPWQENKVTLVVEASGRFKTRESLNGHFKNGIKKVCLLYTSPSPRDRTRSRMPSSA